MANSLFDSNFNFKSVFWKSSIDSWDHWLTLFIPIVTLGTLSPASLTPLLLSMVCFALSNQKHHLRISSLCLWDNPSFYWIFFVSLILSHKPHKVSLPQPLFFSFTTMLHHFWICLLEWKITYSFIGVYIFSLFVAAVV